MNQQRLGQQMYPLSTVLSQCCTLYSSFFSLAASVLCSEKKGLNSSDGIDQWLKQLKRIKCKGKVLTVKLILSNA